MVYVAADPLLTVRALFGINGELDRSLLEQQIPTGALFVERGRVALWAALVAMEIGPGQTVLLPSYICDSVLGPIEAVGAAHRYYPVDERLQPDLRALERELDATVRAVVVVHYFGFPAPIGPIKALCEDRGVYLIEDCAHALYSFHGEQPLGRLGHAAIFSPWKSLPIPDGGVLVLNDARLRPPVEIREPSALKLSARIAYRSLPTFETAIGWTPRLGLLNRSDLRGSLQQRDRSPSFPRRAGSDFSRQVLERSPGGRIRDRRRRRFEELLGPARRHRAFHPLYPDLPLGACPLGLPLLAERRDEARRFLLGRGINVRSYWERLPEDVTREEHPGAWHVADRVLVLPTHQSVTPEQVQHTVSALNDFHPGADR